MNSIPAQIGAPIDEIDTPALIVDLDAFEYNLDRMAVFAREAGVRLRPHAKTHKCPTIARKQVDAGAIGQCVQKVGEAEALVRGGIRDLLVSNEVVGLHKLRRLASLATDATIGLCFDAPEQVAQASQAATEMGVTLGGLVEIEVGMYRCGVATPEAAAKLADQIANAPGLAFRGLQAYHGTAQHMATLAERQQAIARAAVAVRAAVDRVQGVGLPCEVICGAGTGTFRMEGGSGLWNELQVGSYVFMDTEYARISADDGQRFREFRHSLFVLATVMSAPAADRVIVDAGLKSYSAEKGLPWVHLRDNLEVVGASDEHGKIRIPAGTPPLHLGDQVMLIPGHCDPTVNLHDWYVAVRNGRVESLWPITARGAST